MEPHGLVFVGQGICSQLQPRRRVDKLLRLQAGRIELPLGLHHRIRQRIHSLYACGTGIRSGRRQRPEFLQRLPRLQILSCGSMLIQLVRFRIKRLQLL
ncbi:hypothetical protein D3C75_789240 [compost metagenome]